VRVAVFDTHTFDRAAFSVANERYHFELAYFDARLTAATSKLAAGFPVVCPFVNDRLDAQALNGLGQAGVRLVALRSAGYNHVDLTAARALGIRVVRVPEYSPYAVAEHAVALLLALNRKIHRAFNRVREANFSLDGLVGFDLHGKTAGLIGTGRIGSVMATILHGFGCRLLASDPRPNASLVGALGLQYVDLADLYRQADIVSLHVPLTPATRHLIDAEALGLLKRGVVIINTGRGALIDTRALIDALKTGHVGAAGLDVYEEEEGVFFHDLSDHVLQDDVLARLLTFPNVLITSHQGFLTREALHNIAETTLANIQAFERGEPLVNEVAAG
jgi:D-lactate dehydrogenase